MIECLKSFKRIPNLKIIVAMREDLYESTLRATTDKHFQSEKHEGMIKRLRWSKELLHKVMDQRIEQLFCAQYTTQGVRLEDVLPTSISGLATRSFLVKHTLQRPRDVIAIVNKILSSSEGMALPLPTKAVTSVEPSFSRDRLRALEDEWRSCHPLVKTYLKCLTGMNGPTPVGSLNEDSVFELLFEVAQLERKPCDDLERIALGVYDRDKELRIKNLAQTLVCCLFKMGAIGVKVHADQPYAYCYDQQVTLQESEIGEQTRFVVHPMLLTALGCRPTESVAA